MGWSNILFLMFFFEEENIPSLEGSLIAKAQQQCRLSIE
jgi:hypothetical protein